jgi:hypothetical protein
MDAFVVLAQHVQRNLLPAGGGAGAGAGAEGLPLAVVCVDTAKARNRNTMRRGRPGGRKEQTAIGIPQSASGRAVRLVW